MQGEFAAKKCYEVVLGHYICTELGQGGHELLTLLAAHASKRMDCSTGVEPADQSCLGKIYQCGGNREIPRFRPTALDIAQAPPRLLLRISPQLLLNPMSRTHEHLRRRIYSESHRVLSARRYRPSRLLLLPSLPLSAAGHFRDAFA